VPSLDGENIVFGRCATRPMTSSMCQRRATSTQICIKP
jgi:hypothetical protein